MLILELIGLQEAGVPIKLARSIGVSVDHRRRNRSLEGLQVGTPHPDCLAGHHNAHSERRTALPLPDLVLPGELRVLILSAVVLPSATGLYCIRHVSGVCEVYVGNILDEMFAREEQCCLCADQMLPESKK